MTVSSSYSSAIEKNPKLNMMKKIVEAMNTQIVLRDTMSAQPLNRFSRHSCALV